MKKIIIKSSTFILIFLLSVIFSSRIMNQGNMDSTMEVSPASMPIAYMILNGERANAMFGYSQVMQPQAMRETITPIGDNRTISMEVDTYGMSISKVKYEVRSIDGSRLVENTEVFNYTVVRDILKIDFSVKDLISPDVQYCLVLLLETEDGQVIRYYSRIIQNTKYHLEEQLTFAKEFHEGTFAEEVPPIVTEHMESNSSGDNTTYAKVNIHSKLKQVTWGDLNIMSVTKPVYMLQDISEDTACIKLQYLVTLNQDSEEYVYRVEEYYRTKYTSTRMYLHEFERTMDQLLKKDNTIIMNNKVVLGISTGDVVLNENQSATNLAFEQRDTLFAFHIAENKLAVLYNPYVNGGVEYRTVFARQKVKVLSVDETGDIVYVVYGHLSQGKREGKVGVQIFRYDATLNNIEEKVFIPYNQSESVLMNDIDRFAYVNINNIVYLLLGNNLCRVNLNEANYEILAENMQDDTFQFSNDYSMISWLEPSQDESDYLYNSTKMNLMNLSTEKKTTIEAQSNCYIMPLGFMNQDLIYGEAYKNEIVKDYTGNIIFPMFQLQIEDINGNKLKEYAHKDIYVTSVSMQDNLIALKRMKKEDNQFVNTTDDQILCNEEQNVGKNSLITVATQNLQLITEISLTKNVTKQSTQILTPKEVIVERDKLVDLGEFDLDSSRFYVYGKDGIAGVYTKASDAVKYASTISGVVTDSKGAYIWRNSRKYLANQIMAIKGEKATSEKNSMAVCLEAILTFENSQRNVSNLLNDGKSPVEILEQCVADSNVLYLGGCSLQSVLYYVSVEYPVLAILNDGSAVLIVGYNQQNTVLMNPESGAVYKKGMKDSTEWFSENGNIFITYIKK